MSVAVTKYKAPAPPLRRSKMEYILANSSFDWMKYIVVDEHGYMSSVVYIYSRVQPASLYNNGWSPGRTKYPCFLSSSFQKHTKPVVGFQEFDHSM